MANKHSKAEFPNRQLSVRVKNVGSIDMPLGSCALISYTSGATCLGVWITATTVLSTRQKVLGAVDFTSIGSGDIGTVRIRGRHTSILAQGTVSPGDILSPHQTVAGVWSGQNTGTGSACIISHGTISGANSIERIEGHVNTWRV